MYGEAASLSNHTLVLVGSRKSYWYIYIPIPHLYLTYLFVIKISVLPGKCYIYGSGFVRPA